MDLIQKINVLSIDKINNFIKLTAKYVKVGTRDRLKAKVLSFDNFNYDYICL